ncbi:hypothetical protein B0H63DRAFT_555233 [Podospora didyma]|uniref:Fungal-type protein kinase domain-containing protein n=1 Tax=Podospora didyma TaxID=330526 RepID=A0AAE0P6M2_9PEZI|nr:hypothetical protein B0H63DRAFT_555233 [Podospora didyma]
MRHDLSEVWKLAAKLRCCYDGVITMVTYCNRESPLVGLGWIGCCIDNPHNVAANNIRVFGEFHQADALVETDDDEEAGFNPFVKHDCEAQNASYVEFDQGGSRFSAARSTWSAPRTSVTDCSFIDHSPSSTGHGHLVEALRSLHLDGGIIHRDVAISILSRQNHSYRHDLESLFYVLLWIAIGKNHDLDDACGIPGGLPESSRLGKWCGMDFRAVRRDEAADMSAEGFWAILDEFSPDFASVRDLAKELHALLFPLA